MSDDRTKRGPQDSSRINITENYEVQYWTEKFGVSSEQLRNAVQRVGSLAADVEKALKEGKK
ncbi:MAG: hypothetical protein K0Q79_3647 [Flavipsychrobacter sp.]|nr:hypothetical protein [Flavipsychrobacter sp.]